MLSAQVLNSDATLNTFDVINAVEFIAGSEFDLVIRLIQMQRRDRLRFVAPDASTLTIHISKKDGTVLDVPMTGFDGDFSMWHGTVSAEDSENIVSGNITFTLDDGTKEHKGWIQNALSLIVPGGC